jgi:hypothetical protein
VEKIMTGKADVVGGIMLTQVQNRSAIACAIELVLAHPFGVGNALFRTGIQKDTFVDTVPFGLYKTDLLRSNKGYNERLIRNHDIELSKRLLSKGARIMLTPEATCTYFARENWQDLAKNNFDNGMWNLLTLAITRDFSSLSIRHFVPFVFVSSVFGPLILMLWQPFFGIISLVLIMLHLSFITLQSLRMKSHETKKVYLVITFLALHWSYGIGSWAGAFKSIPIWLTKQKQV